MENRNYKFVNKTFEVSYMVTKEELELLNASYNHQEYCEFRQYAYNSVGYLADLDTEEYSSEEKVSNCKCCVEQEVIGKMFVQELLDLLTEEECLIITRLIIEKCKMKDLEAETKKNRFALGRTKEKALKKMMTYLQTMGINSFQDALEELF